MSKIGFFRFINATIALTLLGAASAAQAQMDMVSNGTFNSPSYSGTEKLTANSTTVTGWTVDWASPQNNGIEFGTGVGGPTFPSGPGLTGSQGVLLGVPGVPVGYREGGIQQTLPNTIPGQAYMITVYAKDLTNGAATVGTVNFGGETYTFTGLNKTTWTSFTCSETAGSSSTLLDITGNTANSDGTIVANVSVTLSQAPTIWSGTTSNDWGNATNWYNRLFVPSGQGVAVTFGTASEVNATATLQSSSQTAGIVNFVNGKPTTISASSGNYLYLDDTGGSSTSAAVNVAGSHSISAPIQLNSPAAVTVTSGTDQLTVSGVMANGSNGAMGVLLAGNGTLRLSAANTMSGSVSVASGTLLLSNNAALQNAKLAGGVAFDTGITSPVLGGAERHRELRPGDHLGAAGRIERRQ